MSGLRRIRRLAVLVAAVAGLAGGLAGFDAQAEGAASIAGSTFQDENRNGVRESNEPAVVGSLIYLHRDGAYLTNTRTSADGSFRFDTLPTGNYVVEIAASTWNELRNEWVPTTTTTLRPRTSVTLTADARVDFGVRRIVRSTDVSAPISSYVGPSGMSVASYNDAVAARAVHDALLNGLVAREAPTVTVRFDLVTGDYMTYSGAGSTFRSTIHASYLDWYDLGDVTLSHEYGHAWSLYYAHVVQNDPDFTEYLRIRGLLGDARLGSSHSWDPAELIAEDYRQLFGSASARQVRQENAEVAAAADVAGLRDYLGGPFMSGATAGLAVTGLQVTPQPVKTTGTISFSVSTTASVSVAVLDGRGKIVRTITSGTSVSAGSTSFVWDRKNAAGQRVKTGTYVASVTAVGADGRQVSTTATFNVA